MTEAEQKERQEAEQLFAKHFKAGMVVNDFAAFKRTHPTLTEVVVNTLIEAKKEQKRDFYDKLSKKLHRLRLGEFTLIEYCTEVDQKVINLRKS